MTPRPTDSTGEFESCSDEVEELCRSELKKCLRVPKEQAPLKGLDLTYTEHSVKILETSERVTWNRKIKACRIQWNDHTEKMSCGRPIMIPLLASPESRDEIPVRG